MDSDAQNGPRTVTRLTVSDSFFDIACAAVFHTSLAQRRTVTLRATVIIGLDNVIKSTRYDRFMWLKRWDRENLRGNIPMMLQFNASERRLIRETQNMLQDQSLITISVMQTIIIALLTISPPQPKRPD